MTSKMNCPHCHHPLNLHYRGVCSMQKCKCKIAGFTPAQAKVLDR